MVAWCVPCLRTLRHDNLPCPFPPLLLNDSWMVRILPFLSSFLIRLCNAAYDGPHTLLRKTSLKRGNEALPVLFSFLLGFVWVPLGN